MTKQTEAQRLADALKKTLTGKDPGLHIELCNKAIDELRRLEAANAELLESLISIAEDSSDEGARECAMDAIKKHGGAA